MKLNRNSWHAKLNIFVYGWSYLDSVDCLCPYFWGTLLAIFLSPWWALGKGLARTIDAIPETNYQLPSMSDETKDKVGLGIAYSVFTLAIMGITFSILHNIAVHGLIHVLWVIGVIALVTGVVVGFIIGCAFAKWKYDDWRSEHPKEEKEKRENLLMEFIKAKKNKHCPLVEWV